VSMGGRLWGVYDPPDAACAQLLGNNAHGGCESARA
jgi:hypothetical protein